MLGLRAGQDRAEALKEAVGLAEDRTAGGPRELLDVPVPPTRPELCALHEARGSLVAYESDEMQREACFGFAVVGEEPVYRKRIAREAQGRASESSTTVQASPPSWGSAGPKRST